MLDGFPRWFIALWLFGVLCSLTLFVVVIWGVITLINHFTGG
jgi:hypothetical protein